MRKNNTANAVQLTFQYDASDEMTQLSQAYPNPKRHLRVVPEDSTRTSTLALLPHWRRPSLADVKNPCALASALKQRSMKDVSGEDVSGQGIPSTLNKRVFRGIANYPLQWNQGSLGFRLVRDLLLTGLLLLPFAL